MEKSDFKKLLFKTAFCVMACDGHIDDLEIEEMKRIDSSTAYFNDFDLSDELEELIAEVKTKGKLLVVELFQTLRETNLSVVQELLIMEVALRIINADNIIDENEIKFLNILRSKLSVENQILRDRFGEISYLKNLNYTKIKKITKGQNQFIKNIKLPDADTLSNLEL